MPRCPKLRKANALILFFAMTDEIEDYDEELQELEDEIARGIKQINSFPSHDDKLKVP